ncbi:MAG: DedA family protein [Bacteroidia bacterium]|nr:DedA family protein [Bacteroidia bacterium]
MGITEFIVDFVVNFIDSTGYISVLILMALESMIAPVPSEAVMPFAGFLIARGRFTFAGVIIFSTLGSIIGSLISYFVGAWGGKPVVEKFGKYLLLNKEHLAKTEKYFKKHGEITILVCRFIPVVRHLISLPAGIGKMNLFRFSLYTIIGASIWNAFLTYVGYSLQKNWQEVIKYSHKIDIAIVVIFGLFITYYIYKLYSNHRKRKKII